jgi:hypothetical protein
MTELEIIKAARALIDTPEKWTKRVGARDSDGAETDVLASSAVCFCVVGACRKATGPNILYVRGLGTLRSCIKGSGTVHEWNDAPERTHADVMELFDRAIAELEWRKK